MTTSITLIRKGSGARGDLWRVHQGGAVIIDGTRHPEFDACRYFSALGVNGLLEIRHVGSDIVSMRIDIVSGAGLTVIESAQGGPRLGAWQKFHLNRHLGTPIAASASEPRRTFEAVPVST